MGLQLKEVLEKNKVLFEKEFGKKWDEDLSAFLGYINLIHLRMIYERIISLGVEHQSIDSKLDMNGAKIDELRKDVERKALTNRPN